MPKFEITAPDGRTFEVTAPDGATQEDVLAYAQGQFSSQPKPGEGLGERMNREIASIPRQVGLTARYGAEGVGDALDFLSSPIRAGLNAVLPSDSQIQPGAGKYLADKLGLPSPETDTERTVASGAKLMATGAVPIASAGKLANGATGVTKSVLQSLSGNAGSQIASAGSAGLAGEYVKETGGNDASQFAAALGAGLAAPLAVSGVQKVGGALSGFAHNKLTPASELNARIDVSVDNALKDSGLRISDLPAHVKNSIRSDVAAAFKSNGDLSPAAIRRLADYRLTGTTPTAATLTLDPAMVSQQKNLAKLGINSKDKAAQALGRVENANNRQLIEGLNDLGANTTDDALAGGQKVINALQGRIDTAKGLIGARYDAARATSGRSADLDRAYFAQTANDLLDDSLLGGKVPADVRNMMNWIASGKKAVGMHSSVDMPFNVNVAEQLKTRIGELQRATNDMAERKALGLVRKALDDTPLMSGGADVGQQSIDAFNKARRLNRAWEGIVDKTPALQAVREGVEPDKFVQTFIVGNGGKANTMDLAMLKRSVKGNPEAMDAIKGQITAYLKKSALNGAADEVGNFSQSAYNKALSQIGERKLSMFFSPDEVAQMKAIGRVASYEQLQPRGAAVNNANTAGAALSTILDRVAESPLLSKIPLGQWVAQPAQNISVGIKANQAMSVPQSLLAPQVPMMNQPPAGLLVSPAAFMQVDEEKRRGLLAP